MEESNFNRISDKIISKLPLIGLIFLVSIIPFLNLSMELEEIKQ